jgi:DNA polymerase-3 subunit delta'
MANHCTHRDHDACGHCQNCVAISNGNHPDVRFIEPPPGKKEIGINQIRELQRELSFRSFSGRIRVAIIDPADLMNYHAQNALLKTLEEPPHDALLVLIAKGTGGLTPTLLSRCLRVPFGPLPLELVVDVLVRKKGLSPEPARLLAGVTMGSLGTALTSDTEEALGHRKVWIERFCTVSGQDYRGMMKLAEERAKDREGSLQFLQWIEGWYRDILIFQIAGSTGQIRNLDMAERIKEQAALSSIEHSLNSLARAERVARGIQRNYNRRMALEDFLIKTATSEPGSTEAGTHGHS